MAPTDRQRQIEPLPPRIAALVEAERGNLLVPSDWPEVEARVWRGIQTGVAIAPRWRRWGSSLMHAKSGSLMPLVVGVVVGATGSAALLAHSLRRAQPSPIAEAPALRTPPAPEPSIEPPLPASSPAPAVEVTNVPAAPAERHETRPAKPIKESRPASGVTPAREVPATPAIAAANPAAGSAGTPARPPSRYGEERDLLDRAGDALRRSAPADAYAMAQEHARRFPDGSLSEERELIAIRALKALQQKRAMVERILEFHRRHPNSLLIPAVDALAPSVSGD